MQPQPLMKLDIAPPLGQMRPQLRYPQPQEDTFHEVGWRTNGNIRKTKKLVARDPISRKNYPRLWVKIFKL